MPLPILGTRDIKNKINDFTSQGGTLARKCTKPI